MAFYFAGEITQVLDVIPWVRCASGNVLICYCYIVIYSGILVVGGRKNRRRMACWGLSSPWLSHQERSQALSSGEVAQVSSSPVSAADNYHPAPCQVGRLHFNEGCCLFGILIKDQDHVFPNQNQCFASTNSDRFTFFCLLPLQT